MRLANENEELGDIAGLTPEQMLLRWANFHLKAAGQDLQITNMGKDLVNTNALFYILNQIDPANCTLEGVNETDPEKRAEHLMSKL